MPDLSATQIGEIQTLVQSLCPTLGKALSEQLNSEVTLDLLDVRGVSLTELLQRPEPVLQTQFSFSAPEATDGVFYASEEVARIFVDLMEGMSGGDSTQPLSDTDLDTISAAMSGLVRGLATGLHDSSGEQYDIESISTQIGTLVVPPVFALEGSAVEVQLVAMIPDVAPVILTALFTLRLMAALTSPAAVSTFGAPSGGGGSLSEDEVAAMFNQVSGDDYGVQSTPATKMGGGMQSPVPDYSARNSDSLHPRGLEMILDIPLDVTVELGRVRMLIRDVLELSTGSVIELDRVAGEPVDLLVNGRLVAKGEVVVIEDNFGLRITEIVSPAERVAGIGKGDRR